MGKIRRAIGLMSGTSMDGIDVAALDTDGDEAVRRLGTASVPYTPDFRGTLRAAIDDAVTLTDRTARPGCLAAVEQKLTELHVDAVRNFVARMGWNTRDVDIVGFHGQTVLHRPNQRLTVQLGDGPALAGATGIPVVYDLRGADVAAGGEGAPLAPAYHRAMLAEVAERPVAVVNIGGVANVTWIGQSGELLAFDTGPGNALIDDWMSAVAGLSHDEDGAAAARGTVRQDMLDQLCRHAYFGKSPPKSLDRNAFTTNLLEGLSVEDGRGNFDSVHSPHRCRSKRAYAPGTGNVGHHRRRAPQCYTDGNDCGPDRQACCPDRKDRVRW